MIVLTPVAIFEEELFPNDLTNLIT